MIDAAEHQRIREAARAPARPGAGGGARAHAPTEGVRVRRRLAGLDVGRVDDWSADTTVKAERLRAVAEVLRHPPAGFALQARAKRLLDERYRMVERGEGIDWGCAETLAYGTLLLEGFPVRLSRPGHRARHLQSPPRRALRRRDRRRLGAPGQPRPGPGLVRGREQPALRDGRAGLRVRNVERRSPAPRPVGGAVRRLRQRRAGDRRPVHRRRRVEVAAHERAHAAPAPWLRRPGARALERPARALPSALRRGQHAGRELHDARPVLPRAPAPDAPAVPQAPHRHEPQEPAPSSPRRRRPCPI